MKIINGDCLDVMKTFPDNHFSAVVTDPPYGLSFMNKGWDKQVPGPEYWKECIRVTKPGGHIIAMGGTRTFHRLTCAIEDAGWEIRDCISWLYGSGFPKSHNHFGIEGYGTALKPAWEPCILAMKPLDGTFKQNAEKWGQAGINIADTRVPSDGEHFKPEIKGRGESFLNERKGMYTEGRGFVPTNSEKGRWPANLILDEEASAMLDEQSGFSKSSGTVNHQTIICGEVYGWAKSQKYLRSCGHQDGGGASRFFYCAKASASERNEGLDGLPDILCQTGCSGSMPIDDDGKEGDRFKKIAKNNHPTVKPLKLMEYLIKLVMPRSGGILLDPFAGSGTTLIAARNLGFEAIGIEKSDDYCKIATARLEAHDQPN